ncbi:hypothetical protein BJ508DRAFT_419264 [Ascobolus immersus RN42]|uniref:ubiquitinyl hydrolase 1 n=1 Tax=Ascobolus immersus RN42 TaxID=1160509 RepID=A0A3N4HH70_ASCIM|nr:hypothetical protein BJ508DRAFT_419264 [Ascobolus immersus RN42]
MGPKGSKKPAGRGRGQAAAHGSPDSDAFSDTPPTRGRGATRGRGRGGKKKTATRKMSDIDDGLSDDREFCTDDEIEVAVPKTPKQKQKKIKVNMPDFNDPQNWKPFLRNPMPPDWAGWLSVESDPKLFSDMLRKYGVSGLEVQEVFSLDEYTLSAIRRPVYGIILLMKYDETEDVEEEIDELDNLWFANQIIHADNACATYALLNVVMNITSTQVNIGEHLDAFKWHTSDLPPPSRGLCLSSFDYIRNIHNQNGKRLEAVQSDIKLYRAAEAIEAEKTKRAKAGKSEEEPSDNHMEPAYHFVAYVPAFSCVWEMDGMKRFPKRVGELEGDEDWIGKILPVLAKQAEKAVENEVTVLCVVADEYISARRSLYNNAAVIACVDARLDKLNKNWRNSVAGWDRCIDGEDLLIGAQYAINRLPPLEERIANMSYQPALNFRKKLVEDQAKFKNTVQQAARDREEAEEYGSRKRHNYMPFITEVLSGMVEEGIFEETILEIDEGLHNQSLPGEIPDNDADWTDISEDESDEENDDVRFERGDSEDKPLHSDAMDED